MEIDITKQRTHAIIDRVGTTRDKVIPLLQAIQQEFNYLPSDALNCVYESTDIDRAQLLSVATFYSQFRMAPYGQHVIKVCIGTACHVKGASHVYDAFVRELNLAEGTITTADGRYSIEKVACLGCCALAPVVQIDDKIFGHVQPGKVREVLEEFESTLTSSPSTQTSNIPPQGEVRLGMENCCQASGTAEVYTAVTEACHELGINVRIKPISCVGACNQVPLIDVVSQDGELFRYPNIKPDEVKEILLHHFKPASRLRRMRNAILNHLDTFHTDQTWNNSLWIPEEVRTEKINTFLEGQYRISTEGYGNLNPLDIDEYISLGGFEALRKALTEMSGKEIIDEVLKSGIRGRGGGGFPTGRKWQLVADAVSTDKYVICNGDEGDPILRQLYVCAKLLTYVVAMDYWVTISWILISHSTSRCLREQVHLYVVRKQPLLLPLKANVDSHICVLPTLRSQVCLEDRH